MRIILFLFLVLTPCVSYAEAVHCPGGAELEGLPPPDGNRVMCVKHEDGKRPFRHGPLKVFFRSGKTKMEGHFMDGQKDGSFKVYFRTGQLRAVGEYSKGEKDGDFAVWYKSGLPKAKEQWILGKRDGEVERFYKDGSPKFRQGFRDGKPHGDYLVWFKAGKPRFKGNYWKGAKQGHWTAYYKNGEKKYEGDFDAGRRDKEWKEWRKDGTLKFHADFASGRMTKRYPSEAPLPEEARSQKRDKERRESELDEQFAESPREKRARQKLLKHEERMATDPDYRQKMDSKQAKKQSVEDRLLAIERHRSDHSARGNTPLKGMFNVRGLPREKAMREKKRLEREAQERSQ